MEIVIIFEVFLVFHLLFFEMQDFLAIVEMLIEAGHFFFVHAMSKELLLLVVLVVIDTIAGWGSP